MSFELIHRGEQSQNDLINSNRKLLLLYAFIYCFYTYFYVSTGLVENKNDLFIYLTPSQECA
jgi:hypothetical protein